MSYIQTSGGGGTWGSITGTLSAQTDLNTALGLKAPLASPTFTGTVNGAAAIWSGDVSAATVTLATNKYLATTSNAFQIYTSSGTGDQIQLRTTDTAKGASGLLMNVDAREYVSSYTDWYFYPDNTQSLGTARNLGTPKTSSYLYRIKSVYVGTSVSGGEDDTANASAATSLLIQAQSKSAGTGNGGALNLAGGTSTGGTAGAVNIQTAGSTRWIVSSTGKLSQSGSSHTIYIDYGAVAQDDYGAKFQFVPSAFGSRGLNISPLYNGLSLNAKSDGLHYGMICDLNTSGASNQPGGNARAIGIAASTRFPNSGGSGSIDGERGGFGFVANSDGSDSPLNVGLKSKASAGLLNFAVVGHADTAKDSGKNVGVTGLAKNTGTGTAIAGLFRLQAASDYDSAAPAVDAALYVDNADQAFDIINACDNATSVFKICDGGVIRTNQLTTNTNTPSGATAKYLEVKDIAGTSYYIPAYSAPW